MLCFCTWRDHIFTCKMKRNYIELETHSTVFHVLPWPGVLGSLDGFIENSVLAFLKETSIPVLKSDLSVNSQVSHTSKNVTCQVFVSNASNIDQFSKFFFTDSLNNKFGIRDHCDTVVSLII